MNKWESVKRYVKTPEGWIIDMCAGYIAIRKADGKAHISRRILERLRMCWSF